MPKIEVQSTAPDKSGGQELDDYEEFYDNWVEKYNRALDRCIKDLLYIQNHPKLYINEKKQLQALVYKLNQLDYYEENETAMDKIGLA